MIDVDQAMKMLSSVLEFMQAGAPGATGSDVDDLCEEAVRIGKAGMAAYLKKDWSED